jgi:hypothetical protein
MNPQSRKRVTADLHFRPPGHRPMESAIIIIIIIIITFKAHNTPGKLTDAQLGS